MQFKKLNYTKLLVSFYFIVSDFLETTCWRKAPRFMAHTLRNSAIDISWTHVTLTRIEKYLPRLKYKSYFNVDVLFPSKVSLANSNQRMPRFVNGLTGPLVWDEY